jgi:hypothetical protein
MNQALTAASALAKWPGREADHSFPSMPTLIVSLHGVYKGSLTLTFQIVFIIQVDVAGCWSARVLPTGSRYIHWYDRNFDVDYVLSSGM